MDSRELFPRTEGRLPFMLLDRHGSQTKYEFLKHANDDEHKWCACVGAPCGAALRQVGDSAEQNGHFNTALRKAKNDSVALKSSLSMNLKLVPTDAMILIRKAWDPSFGNIATNKKAIAERGWFPFNRMLLNHPEMRSAMTDAEIAEEKSNKLCSDGCNDGTNENKLMLDVSKAYLPSAASPETTAFNFSDGFSSACLDKMLQHADSHNARERIMKRQNGGIAIKDRLAKLPKLSAGNFVKAGANRLGKDIFQLMVEQREEKERADKQKLDLIRDEWQKALTACVEFANLLKPELAWTVKDLEIALKALRRDKLEHMPKRKKDLMDLYQLWKDRRPMSVDEVVKSSSLNLNVVEDSGSKCDALDDNDRSVCNGIGDVNEDELIVVVWCVRAYADDCICSVDDNLHE